MNRAVFQKKGSPRIPRPTQPEDDIDLILPEEPPPPDLIGAEGLAWSMGVSTPTALLLCAVTSAHIAGPALAWGGTMGLSGQQPPTLMAAEGDMLLRRALDRLVANVTTNQEVLLHAAQEYLILDVDHEFVNRSSRLMHNNVIDAVTCPQDAQESELEKTIFRGTRFRLRDNLLHPAFITRSAPPSPLGTFLLGHNHGLCFVAGAVELLLPNLLKRNQRLDELLQFLDGVKIEPQKLLPNTVLRSKIGRIGGLFLFREPDIHWLLENRKDVVRRLIPVSSNPPDQDEVREYDQEKVRLFERNFHRVTVMALARRRAFFDCTPQFTDKDAEEDFIQRRRQFVLRSANDPVDVLSLPDLLMWFLLFVNSPRLQSMASREPEIRLRANEQELVDLAMNTAEALRAQACKTFVQHQGMEQGLMDLERAQKMLKRITDQGPLKRHELVRCFNNQKLALHNPVIDSLLEANFLKEDESKLLHVGPTPSSRLTLDHLLAQILDPHDL